MTDKEHRELVAKQEEIARLKNNVNRLNEIAACMRRQIKRLGGDPDVCYLDPDDNG